MPSVEKNTTATHPESVPRSWWWDPCWVLRPRSSNRRCRRSRRPGGRCGRAQRCARDRCRAQRGRRRDDGGRLVWLAWATYRASPWLAFIGGGLGVIGLFAVMVDNGFNIAGASLADGLELAEATELLGRIFAGGNTAVGMISGLHAVGIILLGVAAMRAGVQSWALGHDRGRHRRPCRVHRWAALRGGGWVRSDDARVRRCGARIAGSGAGDEGAAQPCHVGVPYHPSRVVRGAASTDRRRGNAGRSARRGPVGSRGGVRTSGSFGTGTGTGRAIGCR